MPWSGATFISTYSGGNSNDNRKIVSMPWKGRPSFLPGTFTSSTFKGLCQCLERGDLHFYLQIMEITRAERNLCQCPEWGDLHFHPSDSIYQAIEDMCQCPERGDLHFHKLCRNDEARQENGVNALNGATFISTQVAISELILYASCVNALNGATFISTLASGNPHE